MTLSSLPKIKSNPAVEWIDSEESFAAKVNQWSQSEFLAIDTEFERRTTYFPKFALLQVFDGNEIALIDPLKVGCIAEFKGILANSKIAKVMHSAKEDLEVLFESWDCEVKGLFDTQVAFAFLTGEASIGYAALVEKVCQIQIAKQETQSDWMQRPLTPEQREYAAVDVLYLPHIYQSCLSQLNDSPVQKWFAKECAELTQNTLQQPDFDLDYRMAKDAYRLNAAQLPLFKLLYQWREETARSKNKTRNHIIRDHHLVQVAIGQPTSLGYLKKMEGLHPASVRKFGQSILDIVKAYQDSPLAPIETVKNPRDIEGLKKVEAAFSRTVATVAKENHLAPAILASKRQLKKIAMGYLAGEPFPAQWRGWRGHLLKPQFDMAIHQFGNS